MMPRAYERVSGAKKKYTPEEKAIAKARAAERMRAWSRKNPGRAAAASRRWRERNPDKLKAGKRRANLKLWYGVTPEWVIDTLLAQGGCAICLVTDAATRGGWNVDHSHATKKVRGMLCGHCNRAIGLLRDDPAVCVAAANYLRRTNEAAHVS